MQDGEMLRKGWNISHAMHESVLHVLANGARGLRDKKDTSAAPGFVRHKSASFLNAGED